jgi:uncharacterized membrane protein
MFKKATGQTYIGYLTDVRLNKAVELLNKTDDKTYVIAAKVGYQEQNYFSYVFINFSFGSFHGLITLQEIVTTADIIPIPSITA